jgi:hypothetical protein
LTLTPRQAAPLPHGRVTVGEVARLSGVSVRTLHHYEMEARSMGISLTPEEQFEIFGTDKIEEYQEEAKEKWGDTDAWRESQRRYLAEYDQLEVGFSSYVRDAIHANADRA